MKLYPKNRIIKHTFKYNRNSDCPRSISKSLSQDNNPNEKPTGSRSHKGAGRGGENLLKQSLKNNHKITQNQNNELSSRTDRYNHEYGPGDPSWVNKLDLRSIQENHSESYGGGPIPRRKHLKNPLNRFVVDRPHITPRQIPPSKALFGMEMRPSSSGNNSEKRSQSVHLSENNLADLLNGDTYMSKFNQGIGEGYNEHITEENEFAINSSPENSKRVLTSKFYDKSRSPSNQFIIKGKKPSYEMDGDHSGGEDNDSMFVITAEKLKEYVDNLIED